MLKNNKEAIIKELTWAINNSKVREVVMLPEYVAVALLKFITTQEEKV